MDNKPSPQLQEEKKVGIGAYIALIFAIVIFSGVFYQMPEARKWLSAFDFTTLIGKFGVIGDSKSNYIGSGGLSARAAFLFALSLIPSVMLAMGLIEVLAHYGALRAAQVLLTPLLKPLLGLPGFTALAMITDLQSTDGGAALTRGMYDSGKLSKKGLVTMSAWQYAGAGCVNNYYAIVSALFFLFVCPVWIPMLIIFVLKFVGGMFTRFVLSTVYKKDFEMSNEAAKTTSNNPFDIFIVGLKKGLNIGLYSLLPNVVMAFVLTYILQLWGVMDFLGRTCGGIMGIFDLPGQAITVLLATWMSCGAGVGVAASLASSGVLNGHDVTILAPALILMASQIQYMGRLLGVADVPKKYWPLLMLNSLLMAFIGMLLMRFFV